MGHFTTVNGNYYNLGEIAHNHPAKSSCTRVPWRGDESEKHAALAPEIHDVVAVEEDTSEVPRIEVLGAGEEFIDGLGSVLSCWVKETAATPYKRGRFHSVRAPPMTVVDYLTRIRKYFLCSDECFVMALVYIDRMSKTGDSSVLVCDLTVHRLLLVALVMAAKVHDDVYYSNAYYAKVGGLSIEEVNSLEASMLKLLNWKVFVSAQEYQLYHGLVMEATGHVSL